MSDRNEFIDIETELKNQRGAVPNTNALRASILAESKTLPQKLNVERVDKSVRIRRWFGPRLVACAACLAIVAVMANFLLPIKSNSVPGTEIILVDELEFQELMLIEDELLFAQL